MKLIYFVRQFVYILSRKVMVNSRPESLKAINSIIEDRKLKSFTCNERAQHEHDDMEKLAAAKSINLTDTATCIN